MSIRFEGDFTVDAPREEAFAFLSDPRKFAHCLPTFEKLDMKDDRHGDVTVKIGVGKIRGKAIVELVLKEEEAPVHAAYDGKGKIMGSAFNFETTFDMEETESGGTKISWAGDLVLFGKLLALAGGIIRPTAKKEIKRMIDAIQAAMSPNAASDATG
jgi:carbon monoxide dehydrogenase subunit G